MFRLAHISDIHLGPLPDVTYRELASKRVIGYVNWQRNRRRALTEGHAGQPSSPTLLRRSLTIWRSPATSSIWRSTPSSELARIWLETLGKPHDVSVVPGNHDAYVPGAFDKACRLWAPWMSGDGHAGRLSGERRSPICGCAAMSR